MDLMKEIGSNKVVLLIVRNQHYPRHIIEIAKQLNDGHKKILYVSLNKLYSPLVKSLKDNSIDVSKFFFVDCITKTAVPNVEPGENIAYIDSASALTKMSICINKMLDSGEYDAILFDSLSTLLIYNSGDIITKFTHDLISKIRKADITATFTALSGDTETGLIKSLGMFVDQVIPYSSE